MNEIGPWDQLKDSLRDRFGQGLFKLWIEPLAARLENGRLHLVAPNEFVASWVRDRLMEQIRQTAAEAGVGIAGVGAACRRTGDPDRPAPARAAAKPPQSPNKPAGSATQLAFPVFSGTGVQGAAQNQHYRFNFDDFVVGPSNELAYAASMGICRQTLPADQIFIASGPGLGKTHLLQAIGAHLAAKDGTSRPRVAYLSSEGFANRLIMAMKAREVEKFKAAFRENIDLLLLEDIHFFQGKLKLQDELVNLLNALQSRGCKVVLSSVCTPKELAEVDKSLASRFCSGFMAVIDRPDFTTRKNILERKAEKEKVRLSEDVSDLLAKHITTDIRQLESCLRNLALKARLLGETIGLDMAWDVLQHFHIENRGLGLADIVAHICRAYRISADQLSSKSRKHTHVVARNTAFFLARKHTAMSLADIGARFNRRHSTVLKGITSIERHLNLMTPLGRELGRTIDQLGK
ncbi:MAG: chromosomal replication initiator protein DnaA [Desulfovibrionaceae bacterium]|nr:chromosomal replication initiator protein DnaA [Desulfovibrionaceae bacterium]MBF0513352.1 chromosomal replication initiator protein DnaA [Desulfovibrionaceae bacterium]